MNARALSVWSLAAVTVVVSTANPVYRALVVMIALNLLLSHRRPHARLAPLLRIVAVATVIATLITVVVSHTGAHALITIPAQVPLLGGALTLEALVFGAASGLGIAAAVLAAAPLSLVVEPHELVDALPRALARSGAAVATALNLLPAIGRSAGEIRDAQRMRGIAVGRLRGARDVAVPVVLTAVEDSVRLAEAMEARGYGSGARTHYGLTTWRARDALVAAAAVLAAALMVGLRLTGAVADWYPFPVVTAPAVSTLAVGACLLLAVPALLPRR